MGQIRDVGWISSTVVGVGRSREHVLLHFGVEEISSVGHLSLHLVIDNTLEDDGRCFVYLIESEYRISSLCHFPVARINPSYSILRTIRVLML